MAAFRGSCLCGVVAFEVEGPFDLFLNCHCSRCRKATGTGAFVRGDRESAGALMASRRTVDRALRSAPGAKLCNRVLQNVRQSHAAPDAQRR